MTDPATLDPGLALAPLLKRAGSVIESEIRGRSMGGTLRQGSRIRIRCGTDADYPDGAVIAFFAGRGLVGHRVVGRGHDRRGGSLLITRGDGALVCDPPVEAGRILGRVAEWLDGEAWRPIPEPPVRPLPARAAAAGVLWLIRTALVIDSRLAGRLAVLLAAVGRRLTPRAPSS